MPELASWLEVALAGAPADVPCEGCTACCESGYFVHVEPDEAETLRRVPTAVRVAAPGLPAGNVVIARDTSGRCALFADGACSIYAHRPRACRVFDCRVFAATGVTPGAVPVAVRARAWDLDGEGPEEERLLAALRAAAVFLREHAAELRPGPPPPPETVALTALRVHHLFVEGQPHLDEVRASLVTRG